MSDDKPVRNVPHGTRMGFVGQKDQYGHWIKPPCRCAWCVRAGTDFDPGGVVKKLTKIYRLP